MELAINIGYFCKTLGMVRSAEIVKNSGFCYLDYTPPVSGDWEKILAEDMEIFKKEGLTVHQCHAPFNRYHACGSRENHLKQVENSLDAAVRLGAKYLVVHGDEFPFESREYTKDAALAYNYELFAPLVERAEKLDVCIAFENVFPDINLPRFCSETEELCALIDRFGGSVCCCWDFGHGAVAYGEKSPGAIAAMGGRIRCTHVHDNYLNYDSHMIPFLGKIDWKASMKALQAGGVPEVLSFEMVYGAPPERAAVSMAEMLASVGEELCSFI